jgi:hypothetical protein
MEGFLMNERTRRIGTARPASVVVGGACAIVLLAACGNLDIGSFGDTSRPDASVPEAGGGGEAGSSTGTGGESGNSVGTGGTSSGSAGIGGRSGGFAGTGGAAGSSAGTGGAAGSSAGNASGGGPVGGSGPSDDVRERAAVDGFFDPPPASAFLLPSGTIAEQSWQYSFQAPSSDWGDPNFDASSFATGFTGFHFGSPRPYDRGRTPWPQASPELWARATLTVTSPEEIPELVFWGRWDDKLEIYVNGELAASEAAWSSGYRYLGLREPARAALRVGDNTIAVHVTDEGDGKYFDLGVLRSAELGARPRSGFELTTALAVYGDTVERFMIERGIPAGVLAVMKRDEVVVSRGFGWSDKAMTTPIAEDAVLRVSVLDSMITGAAIRTLIDEDESLTEDTRVFPLLAEHGLTPAGGLVSNELVNDITLRHLTLHEDGLPPLPSPPKFYQDLGISADEVTIEDAVRWVYAEGPRIVPGTCGDLVDCGAVSATVSRYVIQVLRGDLLTYLRSVVLAPVQTTDIFLAHERLAGRSPREPGYLTLESPYDRWVYLEGQTYLAASAPALVRFSRGYHLEFGTRLVDSLTATWASPDNGTQWFVGGYAGTFSLLIQNRAEEVSIAVIFNIGGDYGSLAEELHGLTISDWGL